MTLTEPTILRTTTAADFLATVPAITGFTARNSIVAVLFRGKRSCGAIRMDMPPSGRTSSYRAVGSWLATNLGRLPGRAGARVDGVAIVVYTDETFAERQGTPHLELWRAIEPKLRRAGVTIKEAACVAADAWASYLDPGRPRAGRPLAEITESSAALEAAFHSGVLPDVSGWSELPPTDPQLAERVQAKITDLLLNGDRLDSFGIAQEVSFDPIALAERLIAAGLRGETIGADELAELNVIAHSPASRDVLLIAMAAGAEHGEHALQQQLEYLDRQAETGETFDELAEKSLTERPPSDDDLFLLGRSRLRPDHDRLVTAIEVLRRAAAHAPASRRAGTLCILTWMLWARGSQSAAARMHELAAQCDPNLLMVETLGWLLDSGYPAWAFGQPEPAQK
jgi:hypothetical protein